MRIAGDNVLDEEAPASGPSFSRRGLDATRMLIVGDQQQGLAPMPLSEVRSLLLEERVVPESDVDNYLREYFRMEREQASAAGIDEAELAEAYMSTRGYSQEEVQNFVFSGRIPPKPLGLSEKYPDLQSFVAASREVRSMPTQELLDVFGMSRAGYVMELRHAMVKDLLAKGYETAALNEQGEVTVDGQVIDESIWESIKKAKFSALGAVYGAVAGSMLTVPGGPIATAAGRFAGGMAGSMVGAMWGKGADVTQAALELEGELLREDVIERMKSAGILDATVGVLGTALISGGVAAYKVLARSWNLVAQGNSKGGYDALKEFFRLDDAQAAEVAQLFEKFQTNAPSYSPYDKALAAVPQTLPGGQAVIAAVAGVNPKATAELSGQVAARAQQLRTAADNISNPRIGSVIIDDLNTYEQSVKSYFDYVKTTGAQMFDDPSYTWSYDALAIEPLFQKVRSELHNPAVLARLDLYLEKVRRLGKQRLTRPNYVQADGTVVPQGRVQITGSSVVANPAEGIPEPLRSFEDLLAMRSTINSFRSNQNIVNAKDYQAIDAVLARVDGEIARVANRSAEGKMWLQEWRKANVEYSKYKTLQDNALYRVLTRPGVNHDVVIAALGKHITDIDGTFNQVMAKLPESTRRSVEGAVFNRLLSKHTEGGEGGLQAIDFPALERALQHVAFMSDEAKGLKRAVGTFADTFRNDPAVLSATGRLALPKQSSYMTTDPQARFFYEFSSSAFNYTKRLMPTQKGRALAMVMRAAKLMENPTNAKALQDVIAEFPPEQTAMLHEMAKQYAAWGAKEAPARRPIYRVAPAGKVTTPHETELGKGLKFYATKEAAEAAKRNGMVLTSRDVLPARIAGPEDIRAVLGTRDDITPALIRANPDLLEKLKRKDYLGVTIGDTILIFR